MFPSPYPDVTIPGESVHDHPFRKSLPARSAA